jgi:hypothetical protein
VSLSIIPFIFSHDFFFFVVLEHVAIDIFFIVYCDEIVYNDEIMLACNHVVLTNNPNMFLKEYEIMNLFFSVPDNDKEELVREIINDA